MITKKLFKWFTDNKIKANTGKRYLLISGSDKITIYVDSRQLHVQS